MLDEKFLNELKLLAQSEDTKVFVKQEDAGLRIFIALDVEELDEIWVKQMVKKAPLIETAGIFPASNPWNANLQLEIPMLKITYNHALHEAEEAFFEQEGIPYKGVYFIQSDPRLLFMVLAGDV